MGGQTTATNPETVEGRIEHTSTYSLYPQGLTDPSDFNAPSFVVQVSWRGEYRGKSGGGWAVHRGPMELLASSASKDPQWDLPERFRRWQYRFATFEDALAAARAVVDHVKVNGRTWAQWRQVEAQRSAEGRSRGLALGFRPHRTHLLYVRNPCSEPTPHLMPVPLLEGPPAMADANAPLISRATVRAHRMAWFVYTDQGRVRRSASLNLSGPGWGYDVECSCGWQTATGGGPKAYIDREVWGHRLSAELGLDGPDG